MDIADRLETARVEEPASAETDIFSHPTIFSRPKISHRTALYQARWRRNFCAAMPADLKSYLRPGAGASVPLQRDIAQAPLALRDG
jgi:hypothetical protein